MLYIFVRVHEYEMSCDGAASERGIARAKTDAPLFCHARNHPEQIFHTCAALRSNQVGSRRRLARDLLLLFYCELLAHFLISTRRQNKFLAGLPDFRVSPLHSDSANSIFFVYATI